MVTMYETMATYKGMAVYCLVARFWAMAIHPCDGHLEGGGHLQGDGHLLFGGQLGGDGICLCGGHLRGVRHRPGSRNL